MTMPLPEHTMSEHDAVEMARSKYVEMARAAQRAGRELPAVGIPASLGDVAKYSVEASQELLRQSGRSSFTVSVSLRELEQLRAQRERAATKEQGTNGQEGTRVPHKPDRGNSPRSLRGRQVRRTGRHAAPANVHGQLRRPNRQSM